MPHHENALKKAARCVRGLLYYLSKKSDVYDIKVRLCTDVPTVKRNLKSARAMACASFDGKVARIGICPNIAMIPNVFLTGVLIHELTHLAFGLVGGRESEVDTDATILHIVPECGYRYEDCEYIDLETAATRTARNLQRVDDDFAANCMDWFAEKCPSDKVSIQWTKKT